MSESDGFYMRRWLGIDVCVLRSVQRARECIVRWQVRCCSPFEVGKSRYFEERHEDPAADEIHLRNFENDGPVHQSINRRGKVGAICCWAQSTIFSDWSFHEIGQTVWRPPWSSRKRWPLVLMPTLSTCVRSTNYRCWQTKVMTKAAMRCSDTICRYTDLQYRHRILFYFI